MADVKLQRIRNQIRNELLTFRNELNKLSVPNYPTPTNREIIDSLEKKLNEYDKCLSNIMGDIEEGDPETIEEAVNKLITYIHNPLIKQDIKFLSWLARAQTRKVPWSFIKCIEKLSQDIIPGSKLLVYCDDLYNYGICWSNSEKLAPYPYYVLSLPSLHRTNILWHTLIGHELFHPRCADFINEHNHSVLTEIKNCVTENHKRFIPKELSDEESGSLFIESERKRTIISISNAIHQAWRRGMEELLSDMACVEIFGPSAILAMNSFSGCSKKNEVPSPDNNFYPPWNYRFEVAWKHCIDDSMLKKIYDVIDDKSIITPFQLEMESVGEIVGQLSGEMIIGNHLYASIAYKEIKKLIQEAAVFVKESLANTTKWYDDVVLKQVQGLIKRLSNGIPPNEVICEIDANARVYKTLPAEIPAIFLAGWIYECCWQKNSNDEQNGMKYMEMSRLLLKACEDTEIIRKIQGCLS